MKRKRKNIHQLTVGLRTQLCKECHDLQTRLCEVDGRPAIFHRWADGDQLVMQQNAFLPMAEQDAVLRRARATGTVPLGYTTEVISQTYAIVEYYDGTVATVRPERVKFTDREACSTIPTLRK